jgi:glutamyl-Q tRNA(Asp) synthetase
LVYRGRFAPSPTGPLHVGSLLAAAASFIDARQAGGEWLVRIEDIDPPREVPGAADAILKALEILGLNWDGTVVYQSTRRPAYAALVDDLLARDLAFPCSCSRKQIRAHPDSGPAGTRYPGTCRQGAAGNAATAVRARTDAAPVHFDDRFQGLQRRDLRAWCGDYIILRRDGLPAYHLAAVADDAAQGITDVVRGADLLEYSLVHCHLQRLLGVSQPRYGHVPVLLNSQGQKLSKRTGAAPLQLEDPSAVISATLDYLGARPPGDLDGAPPAVLWEWAIDAIKLTNLTGQASLQSR